MHTCMATLPSLNEAKESVSLQPRRIALLVIISNNCPSEVRVQIVDDTPVTPRARP